jgi:glutamyl-tRNA reductase
LIDIGDRRNFDPAINEIDNVYLYNVDDLKGVAEENLQERANEAEKAEGIVQEEVHNFTRWIESWSKSRRLRPCGNGWKRYGSGNWKDARRQPERPVGKAERGFGEHDHRHDNKILHAPMSHLKLNSKDEDEKTLYIAALKKLFDLER